MSFASFAIQRAAFCLLALFIVSLLIAFNSSHALAQRDLTDIPPADPELERRSFEVAEGFEVHLYASDPRIAKPIQMNFDERGRLWVASSEVYPHIEPGQRADDKILILEDRDQDGRADKTTVFADGLLIPTGVEPGDGGAYVADSTELLHLKDTDGDGRADQRRVILSGFGTEDTHHILHTFRWGPDGALYFNQSIYIHSHIETPRGVRRLGGGGIWRFRPQSLELDVFVRGFVNPWGHHFDRWGQSFVTDGAYFEGINYAFPGATYVSSPGAQRLVKGLNPGSPKHCGLEVVSGRHLPESWQGDLLTNDFRGHRVCRFTVSEDGSGFAAREQMELLKTSHVAFRPVDVKLGPDGAIYIADWYNPIIQHGEVDFRDPRRDHTHGRIWRVTCTGRALVKPPRLHGVPDEQLLAALERPEVWTRGQARRLLKERGRGVLPALEAWLAGLESHGEDQDPALLDHHRLEGLWVYQSLDEVNASLVTSLARSRDPRIRAAATRVIGQWRQRLDNPLRLLSHLVEDDHPRVRLEAVVALGWLNQTRAVELAMRALDRPVDRFLDYALWNTARQLQGKWMPALAAGDLDFDGHQRHLTFALESVGSPEVVGPLVDQFKQGQVPQEREEAVLSLIAALGEPRDLKLVFKLAIDEDLEPALRARLLEALIQAAQRRKRRPSGDLLQLAKLLDSDSDRLRAAAAKAAGAWKLSELEEPLLEMALEDEASGDVRQAALEGLSGVSKSAAREACEHLDTPDRGKDVRMLAIATLTRLDLDMAAERAVRFLGEATIDQQPEQLVAAFLQRKDGPAALAAALDDVRLPADVAKLGIRAARSTARNETALVAALTSAGGITAGPRKLSTEEMQAVVADVRALGDPLAGELVFRRKELQCMKCHAVAGAGGRVGPDLLSIGASAQVDYLIDSLLQPNKAVKENYHSLVIGTEDGRILTGVKVRQTGDELILRDAEDREVAVPLENIAQQAPGRSLMPDGTADNLTRGELIDLVRFLSALGKVDELAVSKDRVVRRWDAWLPTPDGLHRLRRTSFKTVAENDSAFSWQSAYARVSGELPINELPAGQLRNHPHPFAFARFHLEVSTPGKTRLILNDATGLELWQNNEPLMPQKEMELDLEQGRHRLTLAVNLEERKTPLRVEVQDVDGSPAQVQIVSGK